ncbi:hypothetical protein CCHL11_02842 [Colletotrichum chlorophyti]|uniref:Uncharacterized protein n=1 Tax=Colletotrichum chlorophyti TaxID=708187 RepID=A0A1Q8S0R6_9PEZI|nr:hypothetical protein CCHL11_02842 [Colletotrichum chlorophyti]
MRSIRHSKYEPYYYSKENEWAIIDEEEEEENERKSRQRNVRLQCFLAGLVVVLVPAACGFLWCRR